LWFAETLADGEKWQDVAHDEDNEKPNCYMSTPTTFPVAGGGVLLDPGGKHQQESLRE
jgi:hypothetical protein